MKRWLGLMLSIGFLGMMSEGDASFGAARAIGDGCVQFNDYIKREYGEFINDWGKRGVQIVAGLQLNDTPASSVKRDYHPIIGRCGGFLGRFKNKSHRVIKQQKDETREMQLLPESRLLKEIVIMKEPSVEVSLPTFSSEDSVNKLAKLLIYSLSKTEKQKSKKAKNEMLDTFERSRRQRELTTSLKSESMSMPQPIALPVAQPIQAIAPSVLPVHYTQPVMPQQPVYQNNMQQTAACAMQLQASAMAMQAQASAMMMQAQQQAMPVIQQPIQTSAEGPISSSADKQDKINRLMQKVSVLGDHGSSDVLKLLDIEFEIIEQLLAGAGGQIVDVLVKKREGMLHQLSPLIVSIYELVIDLAASAGKESEDPRPYHYFVRRSKRSNGNTVVCGRKKFLRRMIYQLEQYYQMIEKMLNIVSV